MGYVIPGANPDNLVPVDEVVDVVRFLIHTGDNRTSSSALSQPTPA